MSEVKSCETCIYTSPDCGYMHHQGCKCLGYKPAPTTAEQLWVMIEEKNQTAEGREWLAAGKLVVKLKDHVVHNYYCAGVFLDRFALGIKGAEPSIIYSADDVNKYLVIPDPPKPAKLNSEIVAVGDVWESCIGHQYMILFFDDKKNRFILFNLTVGAESSVSVSDFNNKALKWQLVSKAPVKTLADMGIKRGAKVERYKKSYTIKSIRLRNSGGDSSNCDNFDGITLVKPEVEG